MVHNYFDFSKFFNKEEKNEKNEKNEKKEHKVKKIVFKNVLNNADTNIKAMEANKNESNDNDNDNDDKLFNGKFNFCPKNKAMIIYNKMIKNSPNTVEIKSVKSPNNPHVISYVSSAYTPQIISQTYLVPQTTKQAKNASVTVVIAYRYKNLRNDFNVFSKNHNLPSCTLTNTATPTNNQISMKIYNMATPSKNDTGNDTAIRQGWDVEICLDTQWIHSINPWADINVVQATSAYDNDLASAMSFALNLSNNQVISNSWGADEIPLSNGETTNTYGFERIFAGSTTPFLFSSGDTYSASYPATSPYVIAVGGTTLNVKSDTTTTPRYSRCQEPIWSQEGCGYSSVFGKPSYQNNIQILTNEPRTIPDCSLIADPNLGCIVYCGGRHYCVGGTSLSCPVFAGLISIANQRRVNSSPSKPVLTISQIQNAMYTNNNGLFYDVILGVSGLAPYNNGNVFNTGIGFDVPSGLGVPNFTNLINKLANL
jgi:subtilase family serine protease